MLNLSVGLEESARRSPEGSAIVFGDQRLSFAEWNAGSNCVAAALARRGIGRGDKVALSCPNLPYFPIAYFGILKAGATVVPLNILLKEGEIAYHLRDCEAKAYVCFQGTEELPMGRESAAAFAAVDGCETLFWIGVEAPDGAVSFAEATAAEEPSFETVQTETEDTAVILYTSGTTGQPKGAELSHFNVFMNTRLCVDLFSFGPDDVTVVVLPLFHSFGQVVLMNAGAFAGATSVLLPRFEPQAVFDALESEGVTLFAGVPTMYWALLNHPDVPREVIDRVRAKLRMCVSGGAALPLEVLKGFEERFEVPILEGYGLSETSPVASFNQIDVGRKPGSIGTPIWGVEMKVVDAEDRDLPDGEPGEILVRGHNVMKGYYRRPDANAEVMRGGWFHTGDVAYRDEDGFFFIVDRIKDMIIRGGFNVYPREIEEVMMTHPAISLVAVLGVPHPSHGEEVKAFVVLQQGAEASEQEILDWCADKMAAHKRPRLVEIRDALPMTATGKILKRELRAEAS